MEEAKKKEKSKIRIRKKRTNRGKLKRNKELNKEL